MSNQLVRIRREAILECMTCRLCDKLLRDATTISECLHTFCRKCIYKKLSDEELENCPVCNIHLGSVPLEKLRPDHNLQDVRVNIFPFKRRKAKAPEVAPSVTLPARRKERSLSSLVVSTPKVSTQTAMTGRRSKAIARKVSALRGSSFAIGKHAKKGDNSVQDFPEGSSSPETLTKITQHNKQNSSSREPSIRPQHDEEIGNGTGTREGKVDMLNPLNFLVEAANRSKYSKYITQGSTAKPDGDSDRHIGKAKLVGAKSRGKDGKVSADHISEDTTKPKKVRKVRKKKPLASGQISISPQAVIDAASAKGGKRVGPVWFSLVASEDLEGQAPLPQISAKYLRIKDGNTPVSFIQKYLMRKLELASEDQVEIRCMGRYVTPTLQLNNLIDLWVQNNSRKQRMAASIGSSGKDFVMILTYAPKVQSLPVSNSSAFQNPYNPPRPPPLLP